jgi:D-alanyl-D-alanine carboxypeptidase (penicillin-binding protein 5/6)
MGADGLKTGHLSASGYGLAASAVQDGRRLISVTNGFSSSKKRSQGSSRLLTWGFREFTNINISQEGEVFAEIEIPLAKKIVQVTPTENIKVTVSKAKKDKITQKISVIQDITAPLPAGSIVATLEIILGDSEKVTFNLETVSDVQKTGIIGRFFSFIINLFTSLFSIIFS